MENLCSAINGYLIATKQRQQEVKERQRCIYVYSDDVYTVVNKNKNRLCIYIYICICMCIYIYIYILYRNRERERERER